MKIYSIIDHFKFKFLIYTKCLLFSFLHLIQHIRYSDIYIYTYHIDYSHFYYGEYQFNIEN